MFSRGFSAEHNFFVKPKIRLNPSCVNTKKNYELKPSPVNRKFAYLLPPDLLFSPSPDCVYTRETSIGPSFRLRVEDWCKVLLSIYNFF